MYILSFFIKGDTIQGGSLFKGGHYLRKYGAYILLYPKSRASNYQIKTKTSLTKFNLKFKVKLNKTLLLLDRN